MKLFPAFSLLLAALAAGCATGPETPRGPDVYVMRHLQKADGPDPALSEEGQRNAAGLVSRFCKTRLRAIYVSTTRRARETAAPLVADRKLETKKYDPSDTPALVSRVLAERGPVLVVGHSNTVPEIVERLGGARPASLQDTDYGDIWLVSGRERRVQRSNLSDANLNCLPD